MKTALCHMCKFKDLPLTSGAGGQVDLGSVRAGVGCAPGGEGAFPSLLMPRKKERERERDIYIYIMEDREVDIDR